MLPRRPRLFLLLFALACALLAGRAAPAPPEPPELTHLTPPPQPPLALVRDSVEVVRTAFNAAADRPRLLVMLSPT